MCGKLKPVSDKCPRTAPWGKPHEMGNAAENKQQRNNCHALLSIRAIQ